MRAGLIALVLALVAGARPAAAEESRLESLGRSTAYVVPVAGSVFASLFNGAYLAYGEGAPRAWRTAGYAFGAASIVVGAVTYWDLGADTGTEWVLGGLPIVVGLGSVVLAWQVGAPTDIVGAQVGAVTVIPTAGGGGGALVLAGSW